MMPGIIDYDWYVPQLRITNEEYLRARGSIPAGLLEKSVVDFDEDVVTMAVECARRVLEKIDPVSIDLLCVASTNFPYAYRMVASTLVDALGLEHSVFCTEHNQSARGGTEAFLTALAMLQSPRYQRALVIATDAPQAKASDILDGGFGAASVAFVLGESEVIAEVEDQLSFVHEYLGERFRPSGSVYVEDLGLRRYSRDAMQYAIETGVRGILARLQRKPVDYQYLALQQTDDARGVGLRLGFSKTQIDPAATMRHIGDTGAASSLLALASALSIAAPKERILVASYAPGAGSDVISIAATEAIGSRSGRVPLTEKEKSEMYIDYVTYLKIKGALE